jgi:hypothetical protein
MFAIEWEHEAVMLSVSEEELLVMRSSILTMVGEATRGERNVQSSVLWDGARFNRKRLCHPEVSNVGWCSLMTTSERKAPEVKVHVVPAMAETKDGKLVVDSMTEKALESLKLSWVTIRCKKFRPRFSVREINGLNWVTKDSVRLKELQGFAGS